ncbi:hypothetical protein FGO68_gene9083 [Halteria grandinella]|uniref:Uncharacterized protein n=1 Tax=Halteria grandinella TaxID=5974 RepID=A0A8J8T7D6_HALGN|nr:hypothetical protein FGO68_gene9083 [Halteria grandinella]
MFENVKFDSIREYVREKERQEGDWDQVVKFKRPNNSLVDVLKRDEFKQSVDLLDMKSRRSGKTSSLLVRGSIEQTRLSTEGKIIGSSQPKLRSYEILKRFSLLSRASQMGKLTPDKKADSQKPSKHKRQTGIFTDDKIERLYKKAQQQPLVFYKSQREKIQEKQPRKIDGQKTSQSPPRDSLVQAKGLRHFHPYIQIEKQRQQQMQYSSLKVSEADVVKIFNKPHSQMNLLGSLQSNHAPSNNRYLELNASPYDPLLLDEDSALEQQQQSPQQIVQRAKTSHQNYRSKFAKVSSSVDMPIMRRPQSNQVHFNEENQISQRNPLSNALKLSAAASLHVPSSSQAITPSKKELIQQSNEERLSQLEKLMLRCEKQRYHLQKSNQFLVRKTEKLDKMMSKMKSKVAKNLRSNIHDIYEGFVNMVPDEDPESQKMRNGSVHNMQQRPNLKCIISTH